MVTNLEISNKNEVSFRWKKPLENAFNQALKNRTCFGARDWTRTSTPKAYAPKAYVYTNFTTRAWRDYIRFSCASQALSELTFRGKVLRYNQRPKSNAFTDYGEPLKEMICLKNNEVIIPTIRDASLNIELIVTIAAYLITLAVFLGLILAKHAVLAFVLAPTIFIVLILSKVRLHNALHAINPRRFDLNRLMISYCCEVQLRSFNHDGIMPGVKDDGMRELAIIRDGVELACIYIDEKSKLATAGIFRQKGFELFHTLPNHSISFAYLVEAKMGEFQELYIDPTALCLLVGAVEHDTVFREDGYMSDMLELCSGKYAQAFTVEPSTLIEFTCEQN